MLRRPGRTMGTWMTGSTLKDKALSHISFYGEIADAKVPLPASFGFLLAAIGGIAFVGRRKRA